MQSELVRLPSQTLAQVLVKALVRHGIAADLQVVDDGWQVWVATAQLAEAQRLLDVFRRDPRQLNDVAWQDSAPLEQRVATRGLFSGMVRFGPFTKFIALLCLLVYAAPFLPELGRRVYGMLFYAPGLDALFTEPWRLFTPMLLHFSVLHIAFNLMWWLDLGGNVEKRQGSGRLLSVTLLVAAVSNTAQFLVTGPEFGGLSGVVYGLLGYVWVQGRLRPASGLFLPNNVLFIMLAWLLLCWTGLLGPVANHAHLAGLLAGAALGWFWAQEDKQATDDHI